MAQAQQQRQASMQGQQGMPNGVNQPQRNGTPGGNSNVAPQMANSNSQQGLPQNNPNMAARQHNPGQPAMQANFPNGNMAGMSMNTAGVPQAQMQATMQNAQRMPPPDQMRMAMQRGQFANANQHAFQLQQQQINMASNLTASMNMGNGMPNANMIAQMGQNMNGNMNPSMNGMANNAGSSHLNQVNPQMQSPARPLSSGHMPQLLQIQNNLKIQHPDWTPEQVSKMASDHLQRFLAKQRAQAMSAAAGAQPGMNSLSNSPQIGNNVYLQNGGMQNSPSPNAVQNYQNQLLQQQRMMSQQRQQAGSPGMNQARPASRSATPQNPQQMGMQSPGAQQARS
jgi:chromatin modification-related protein VID21